MVAHRVEVIRIRTQQGGIRTRPVPEIRGTRCCRMTYYAWLPSVGRHGEDAPQGLGGAEQAGPTRTGRRSWRCRSRRTWPGRRAAGSPPGSGRARPFLIAPYTVSMACARPSASRIAACRLPSARRIAACRAPLGAAHGRLGLALGDVDRRLLLALGLQDLGPLLLVGLLLQGQRLEDLRRRGDLDDLDAVDPDAPLVGDGLHLLLDVGVDALALGQRLVERHRADHRAQRGAGEGVDADVEVGDAEQRLLGDDHLGEDRGVDGDDDVVLGDDVLPIAGPGISRMSTRCSESTNGAMITRPGSCVLRYSPRCLTTPTSPCWTMLTICAGQMNTDHHSTTMTRPTTPAADSCDHAPPLLLLE